jgi:CRP-like cAMP-binding protein
VDLGGGMMRRNPYIRKLEQFRELSEADKQLLEDAVVQIVDVGSREDIVVQGSKPEHVHLLIEGWAARYKIVGDGDRNIMAYLIPGDLCDVHIALLDWMDHSIAALTACKVGLIPLASMERVLSESRSLSRALTRSMLVDEAILREWLVSFGARSAEMRTAHFLCEMLLRFKAIGRADGDSFDMPLTQLELGDTMGLSTVHMNRTLKKLRSKGFIEVQDKRVTICDTEALMEFCNFDPLYLHQTQRDASCPRQPSPRS